MKRVMTSAKIYSNVLRRLWLCLVAAALGSLADVIKFAYHEPQPVFSVAGIVCEAILKASLLTAMYALCRRNSVLKLLSIIVIAVFFILSLLNGVCTLFYGFGISMKLFRIIMETHLTEVGEFIPELGAKSVSLASSIWLWVSIAIFVAMWKLVTKIPERYINSGVAALSAMGVVYLVIAVIPAEFGRTTHSIFARSGRCVAKYIADKRMIRELEAQKRPLPFTETLASYKAAEKIFVVIGESASKDHLSLYGYPLPTTPRLDSIRDSLYIFQDAIASSTSTAENMPRLLSFMTDRPEEKEWYKYPTILQLFSRLGFHTYWLSNQEYSGKWSNLSSILSADADEVRYVGGADSEDHYLYKYDEILLPELKKAVAAEDSLQLTFLHLMGSHFQYERRFPKERRRISSEDVMKKMPRKWIDIKKAGIIANYDNSILYTDSILSEVVSLIKGIREPTLMVYLSDHGENVYDDRDYRGRDPKYVAVPFIIYANKAYREKNPEIVKEIERALPTPFSTSELPLLLLHLTGTRYKLYDMESDPLSRDFQKRKRWVDGEGYYKDSF